MLNINVGHGKLGKIMDPFRVMESLGILKAQTCTCTHLVNAFFILLVTVLSVFFSES